MLSGRGLTDLTGCDVNLAHAEKHFCSKHNVAHTQARLADSGMHPPTEPCGTVADSAKRAACPEAQKETFGHHHYVDSDTKYEATGSVDSQTDE